MEIIVKGNTVKLKRDYLTNGEVNYILEEVLKLYNQDGDIDGYSFSPMTMITNFYSLLFEVCIEDYDASNTDDYNKYYNLGVQYELLKVVTNADEAYHLMMTISKDMASVEAVVDKGITKLIAAIMEKIPDAKTMSKMLNKLPKEWQKVVSDYNNIIGKETKEDE